MGGVMGVFLAIYKKLVLERSKHARMYSEKKIVGFEFSPSWILLEIVLLGEKNGMCLVEIVSVDQCIDQSDSCL